MAERFTDLSDFVTMERMITTPDRLWSALLDYFHCHGVPLVSYHHRAVPNREQSLDIRADGFPEEWVCHYTQDRLYLVDPIPGLATRASKPFFWSDAAGVEGLLTEQVDYLRELERSGMGEGLAIQVFGPELRNGYFGLGFGGPRPAIDPMMINQFQIICQIAHLRYCELVPHDSVGRPFLSRRETEVLEWMARGKSNSVIADILQLSTHTVDAYVRRIFEKLQVSDRTSAAIRGVGSGLILAQI